MKPSVCVLSIALGLSACAVEFVDEDGDRAAATVDCDDTNPRAYPGAREIPGDGVDQDCDGSDLLTPTDVDGDGHASLATGGDDCDDTRTEVHPDAVERCGDGLDQDCVDGDLACDDLDEDGFAEVDGDCDDADPNIFPGAVETPYNGVDDDCDPGTRDEDLDGDGFALSGGGDCDDDDATVYPGAPEVPYDRIDQDCSGEDLVDVDRDGYDALLVGGGDCDDVRPDVNPRVAEIPFDDIDQNCDGLDGVDDTTLVSGGPADQVEPAIAFGSGRYLIVWTDRAAAEIHGQLLDDTGALLGSSIIVGSGTFARTPAVASDGTSFLVSWTEGTATSRSVRGQLVSGDGVLVGAPLDLAVTATNDDTPAVIWAGTRYVVVWRRVTSPGPFTAEYWLLARTVTPGGGLGAESVLLREVNVPYRERIRLATDGAAVMVAFERFTRGLAALRFGSDDVASPFVELSTSVGHESDIAFTGAAYVVVFEYRGNIVGQPLDLLGELASSGLDDFFVIANHSAAQTSPAVAAFGGSLTAIHLDSRWPVTSLHSQGLSFAGTPSTPTYLGSPVFVTGDVPGLPDIVGGTTNGAAVWSVRGDIVSQVLAP